MNEESRQRLGDYVVYHGRLFRIIEILSNGMLRCERQGSPDLFLPGRNTCPICKREMPASDIFIVDYRAGTWKGCRDCFREMAEGWKSIKKHRMIKSTWADIDPIKSPYRALTETEIQAMIDDAEKTFDGTDKERIEVLKAILEMIKKSKERDQT